MPDIPGDDTTTTITGAGAGSLVDRIEVPDDQDWILLQLAVGQTVLITLNGFDDGLGSLSDPTVGLRGRDGTLLAFNDDSNGTLNSQLQFTATIAGYYYVDVGGYGDSTGGYELRVFDTDIPADTTTTFEIAPGESLIEQLEVNGDHDWVRIDLVAGQTVTIGLAAVSDPSLADPYLVLRNSAGVQVAFSDDISLDNLDSELTFTASATGTYYIDAGAYQDGYSGTYQITITDHDTIEGTAGNDTLIGTSAIDTINGYAGNDYLAGAGGSDTLNGGEGNDRLEGGQGDDTLNGGSGIDSVSYIYATGDVFVDLTDTGPQVTGQGTDTLTSIENVSGSDYTDNINGNAANNLIAGRGGDDYLTGGAGNDSLRGGTGADVMLGGAGNDSYEVDDAGDYIEEYGSEGTADRVDSSISYTLGGNVEWLTLTGSNAINGTGNALSNVIVGNRSVNTLTGGGGNDTLNGGLAADNMVGGFGNDVYYVDDAGDIVTEVGGEGNDLVRSSVNYTLGADVERLTLIGSAAVSGTGNASPNSIIGNGAANALHGEGRNDTLSAGAGNDQLHGGVGSDRLTGGTGADGFYFDTALHARNNVDTITDFSARDDTIYLDLSVFTAIGVEGALAEGSFHLGTAAADADDRIVYDGATGRLYYDADGNGAGAAVQFAQVTAGTALTNADFMIIG